MQDLTHKADHEFPTAETVDALDAAAIEALGDLLGEASAKSFFEETREEIAPGRSAFFLDSGLVAGALADVARDHGSVETCHALGHQTLSSNNYHRLGLRIGDSHAALDALQAADLAIDVIDHLSALAQSGAFASDQASAELQERLNILARHKPIELDLALAGLS